MVLAVADLEGVISKLGQLRTITAPPTGVVPEHFYALGNHIAMQLTGRTQPYQAADFYREALSHRRETHRAPSGEEIVGIARAAFPALFGTEVENYIARLDDEKSRRRPPH